MNYKIFFTLLLAVSAMTIADVSAQTLYSDAFSRTTGSGLGNGEPAGAGNGASDWGSADNALGGSSAVAWLAGRNGGPTGGAQFTTNGTRAHLFSGAAHTTTNIAALAPQGFSISFDFGRVDLGSTPANGFVSVGTGYDETINEFSPFEVSGNSQFAVLFQQAANGNTGNVNIIEDGTTLGSFDYGDPLVEHSVLIELTPTVAGAYGAADSVGYSLSVDGTLLSSGSTVGGAGFGDLAFATNLFTAPYIDNLVVSAVAVPEPATVSLVLLSGLMLGFRRRRS